MTKRFLTTILALMTLTTLAQNKMRTIDELINKTEPGWALIEDWIKSAKNKVEVLTVDTVKAKDALYKAQITTRSPMGAIIYMTGGLLIDDGWVRILGSGNPKLNRTLPDWNKGKSFKQFGEHAPFLLVADDAIGGFYLLNGGGLGEDLGKIYYLSPDNLEFEPLNLTYTDFLLFSFNGDLDKFYKDKRWKKWREEVSKLDGNQAFNFYPALWTKEGKDINRNSRKKVPVDEQYSLNLDMRKQLGLDKK